MSFVVPTHFIHIEGVLYRLKRTLKESNNPIVDTWKEHLKADKVFKKDGILYFLETVEEAIEVVEDE
jgi:hypothetical protein